MLFSFTFYVFLHIVKKKIIKNEFVYAHLKISFEYVLLAKRWREDFIKQKKKVSMHVARPMTMPIEAEKKKEREGKKTSNNSIELCVVLVI